MTTQALAALGRPDARGRPHFRLLKNDYGEYVLAPSDEAAAEGRRQLDGLDCMRLAAFGVEEPRLVVENSESDFVVLVDGPPDLTRHTPLSLDDAEVLASPEPPVARFGRRDDDVVALTPWLEDDAARAFEPEEEEFRDVPLVSIGGGDLVVERGALDELTGSLVLAYLRERDEGSGTRYGVLANPFGEFTCVPEGGMLEPHEDLRHQAVIRARSLMDGATTLAQAATALRAYADRLEMAQQQGWRLDHPIANDHGFPELKG